MTTTPTAAAHRPELRPDTSRAQADWPTSSPWVTSVGGTALGAADKKGGYGFETDMGDPAVAAVGRRHALDPVPGEFYFGGGGGTSEDFAAAVVPEPASCRTRWRTP